MGLHTCVENRMKEHSMLCKREVKMKNMLVGSIVKYWMMITFIYPGNFWVMESNEI